MVQEFRKAIDDPNINISEVEENFNWMEVGYQLHEYGEISKEYEELLALRIRDSWKGWLKVQYPNRDFIVKIEEIPNEEGHLIYFHEKIIK